MWFHQKEAPMSEPVAKGDFQGGESSPQRFRKNAAKQNWRQAFDNKGNREIADSAPSMIPEAYGVASETFRFARRNEGFVPLSRRKRAKVAQKSGQAPEIIGARNFVRRLSRP
jgi:hypothetical protein